MRNACAIVPMSAITAAMTTPALLPTFRIRNASRGTMHRSTAHELATVALTVPPTIAVVIAART